MHNFVLKFTALSKGYRRDMVNKTFNIYCDESTHLINDGHPYMILSYVSIAYPQIKLAKEQIKSIKSNYGFYGELKWTNVHEATYPMYKELIDYFFMTDMVFRALVVDKEQVHGLDKSFDDPYYGMYYQLLHQNIDLANSYNVYIDIKDTVSHQKLRKLQDVLKWNTSIRHFQFIRSHESCFMQLADVLMGAVNYELRISRRDIEGKVLAKLKLVGKLKEHAEIQALDKPLFFITLK